jgi:hypothetical protein
MLTLEMGPQAVAHQGAHHASAESLR